MQDPAYAGVGSDDSAEGVPHYDAARALARFWDSVAEGLYVHSTSLPMQNLSKCISELCTALDAVSELNFRGS